jgi:hypothetical protein
MTGAEYEKAIKRLSLSKAAAARFLAIDDTTQRRWINGETRIPRSAAILLLLMIKMKLTPDAVQALVQRGSKVKPPQMPIRPARASPPR